MKKIIVAIDGYSGCGKSTLARSLAADLGYFYIDTGAMYRAITYFLIQHNVSIEDPQKVDKVLPQISLTFVKNSESGRDEIALNGTVVEDKIRQGVVADKVSEVAAIPAVRKFAVAQQRSIGAGKGVVMDGRDIGTVVFPEAELKIFVTADPEVRVERRYQELKEKQFSVSKEDVRKNLEERDYTDTHRTESPLQQAKDAIVLDNSELTREEQLQLALDLVYKVIKNA